MHFHGWSMGLKTGMYYLRTLPASDALQFSISARQVGGCTGEYCAGYADGKYGEPCLACA